MYTGKCNHQCFNFTLYFLGVFSCKSCLSAIRTLQKFGHLPSEVEFFKSYAKHGVFRDIRLAAIDAIVDFIKSMFFTQLR